jgi:ribonuclease HI
MRANIMFLWWRAWHHRNNCIFGKGEASVAHLARFLENYYDSLKLIKNGLLDNDKKGKKPMINMIQEVEPHKPETKPVRWVQPAVGWIKVNVDASFLADQNRGSWGAVIGSHEGKTITSVWGKIEHCQSAKMAEAIACYEGLKLSLTVSCNKVVIKTDCLALLKFFDPGGENRSPCKIIGQDFNRLIPRDKEIKLEHISRNANILAHEIAKFPSNELCGGGLHGHVLMCVSELASRDCMNSVIQL